jgi:uncharacterized protein YsxB (DUF464 family)
MINVEVFRDFTGKIVGFTIENHGETHVCAAVSMLAINTVNSIEAFTHDALTCEYNAEEGGYLSFSLTKKGFRSEGAGALLDAMFLGLKSTRETHPEEISILETVRKE